MEFEEFSRQFRERTAQRMLDFEAALARAQNRMERTGGAGQNGRQHRPQAAGQPMPARPRPRYVVPSGDRQVRGILRRG